MDKIVFIAEKFGIEDEDITLKRLFSGHINETYKLDCESGSYILQKVNSMVFKNPVFVMENIELVSAHIRKKLSEKGEDFSRRMVCYLYSEGVNYYIDEAGSLWRMYRFIDNSVSYERLESMTLVRNFGRLLGNVHMMLSDIPAGKLKVTIENFHNTEKRLSLVLGADSKEYGEELGFFKRMMKYARMFNDMEHALKVVHNDAKCSNVLFDNTGRGAAMIDWDTVMPGYTAYDFGDAVRSSCCIEGHFDLERFRVFSEGYFSGYKIRVSEAEYALACLNVTSELAARYFYDFLSEGSYFGDKSPEQKLSRTRELVRLGESIELVLPEIKEIVFKIQRLY